MRTNVIKGKYIGKISNGNVVSIRQLVVDIHTGHVTQIWSRSVGCRRLERKIDQCGKSNTSSIGIALCARVCLAKKQHKFRVYHIYSEIEIAWLIFVFTPSVAY